MANLVKSVMIINLLIILIQICVLGFQIYRWNEIVGSIFSIIISTAGHVAACLGESQERWFLSFYSMMLVFDLLFQLVNMVLLICLQWVVIQFCIYYNVSIDISYYGGIACYDWVHYDYGFINYRDRALIVTILLASVVILRIVQIVFTVAKSRPRHSQPLYLATVRDGSKFGADPDPRVEVANRGHRNMN